MNPQIIKIDPIHPQAELIEEAAAFIQQGGVIAFPTRCLYGLGADALNAEAIKRLITIKQRPEDKPILILIDSEMQLEMFIKNIPSTAKAIMDAFWPGRVTLVFEARDRLPEQLTAKSGKIGVRIPAHPVAVALVKRVKGPITGTSANLSGLPGIYRVQDLEPRVFENLNLILDAGRLIGGVGSTVIDVTVDPPRILREGQVTADQIMGSLTG